MGKKGNWLTAVKKALVSSKDAEKEKAFLKDGKKEGNVIAKQESTSSACASTALPDDDEQRKWFKEKNRWSFRRSSKQVPQQAMADGAGDQYRHPHDHHCQFYSQEVALSEKSYVSQRGGGGDPNKQALAVAVATAAAAEAAVAAAQAAAHVAKLTGSGLNSATRSASLTPRASAKFSRRTREEWAAIRIQAAYRGYRARRALRAMRGLARLQELARGRAGQRQASATMRCMQALVRAQAAVRGRRARLCDHQQKTGAGLAIPAALINVNVGESPDDDGGATRGRKEWDDSTQTVEEVQARMRNKQEAAVKRERAMAYAFSHQMVGGCGGQSSSNGMERSQILGWNWLERWMAARPWENRRPSPRKEQNHHHQAMSLAAAAAGPNPRPVAREASPLRRGGSPSSSRQQTPQSRRAPAISPVRARSATPPAGGRLFVAGRYAGGAEAAPSVILSSRHSAASSSVCDDISVASFSGMPGYMAPTQSARAKLRSHSTPKARPRGGGAHSISVASSNVSVASGCSSVEQQQQQLLFGGRARKRLSFNSTDHPLTPNLVWRPPPNTRSSPAIQRTLSFEGGHSGPIHT